MKDIISVCGLLSMPAIALAHEEHSIISSAAHHWFHVHHGAMGLIALLGIAIVVAYRKLRAVKR